MNIRIEDLKDLCTKILTAVGTSELSNTADILQLKCEDGVLSLSVTNHEYFVKVKFNLSENIDFNATVNAMTFLNLISKTTSDTVELTTSKHALIVKGNGTYKLPLIFDGDDLLELQEINIGEVTSNFNIESSKLQSILTYNSKEQTGIISNPIQKLYYFDENGTITVNAFCACVNDFTLEKPIKILLNNKVVKLFKLFKTGDINFSFGHDVLDNGAMQTKVRFENDSTTITAIIAHNESLINSFHAPQIREIAHSMYDYSVTINRMVLLDSLRRLTLFTDKEIKPWVKLSFKSDMVTISDADETNSEDVFYDNKKELSEDYSASLILSDFMSTLENCSEQYVTINFGNHRAFVIVRGNVLNVVPEVR